MVFHFEKQTWRTKEKTTAGFPASVTHVKGFGGINISLSTRYEAGSGIRRVSEGFSTIQVRKDIIRSEVNDVM